MMNATNSVIPLAPLFYCQLQLTLSSTLERHLQSYEVRITLIQECIQELEWWNHNMRNWNDKTLLNREVDPTIDSDASLQGGGMLQPTKNRGLMVDSGMHLSYQLP